MLPRLPRGIIFDFDDTLVDSSASYAAGLAAVGLRSDDAAFLAARRQVKEQLGAGHPAGHQRLLYFKAMQANHQLPDARGPAALLALAQRYEQAVCQHIAAQWQRLRRTALLQRLAAKASLCVLTNETARSQLTKWAAIDAPGSLFQGLITSEELGHEKPDPANFLAAARLLGCSPKDCLMVGDDRECDIEPALKLGMQAVWTHEFRPNRLAALANAFHTNEPANPPQVASLEDLLL